jgi:phosphatidylserine/phosphatidylglycerophosphate/cardiolipin synthase-like enzyme
MADFLSTNGISYQIENIILGAKKKLVLVSPYLKLSKLLLERLTDASDKDIAIKIIYGKSELNPKELEQLNSLKNVELYYFDNLHAKCYFNESKMVITSMNMYEFSEKNNREMGILIDRIADNNIFDAAVEETASILKASKPVATSIKELKSESKKTNFAKPKKEKSKHKGYCIRCKDKIEYDILKPYCYECYQSWAVYENDYYIEDYCHCCGKSHDTSMDKPECYKCYVS